MRAEEILKRAQLLLTVKQLPALFLEDALQQSVVITAQQAADILHADAQLAVGLYFVQAAQILLRVVAVAIFLARDGGQQPLFLVELDGPAGAADSLSSLLDAHDDCSLRLVCAQYTPVRCGQVKKNGSFFRNLAFRAPQGAYSESARMQFIGFILFCV